MFSKLAYLSPLLSSVDAGWNFGWNCPVVYPKMDLDTKKFEGKWYEIFRDEDHDKWSDQLCTMSYYKSKFLSQDMSLQRTYKKKNWFGEPKSRDDKKRNIRPKWFGDGTPTINHGFERYQHFVLDTDYDNWAVVYGCDTYFLFFHGWYATLLSREPFVEYPYVRAAKDKLDTINYNYDNWVKTGLECGFDAAKTLDEVMIGIFETVPDWNVYGGLGKYGTNEAYKLYYGGSDMPYGTIVNPLVWSYSEWQTVYYDPPGCFSWND